MASRIDDFHITANRLLGPNPVSTVVGVHDVFNDDGYVSDDTCLPENCGLAPSLSEIENTILAFPSAVKGGMGSLNEMRGREC